MQKAEKCKEYRTLNLISQASKILRQKVHKRIEKKIEGNLTEDEQENELENVNSYKEAVTTDG